MLRIFELFIPLLIWLTKIDIIVSYKGGLENVEKLKNVDFKKGFVNGKQFLKKALTYDKLVVCLLSFYVLKTSIAYSLEFSLGISGFVQIFLAFFNAFVTGLLIYSLSYLFKSEKLHNLSLVLLNIFLTLLLLANIYYYREFSDFLSIDTVLKASSNSKGLLGSTIQMFKFRDIFYVSDSLILPIYLLFTRKKKRVYNRSVSKVVVGIGFCAALLGFAEMDRPQLLTRSFDNNYLVKYLGLVGYTSKNIFDYNELQTLRAEATENDLASVYGYLADRRDSSEGEYFGIAKDKDVIYLHLESFQQFLINYRLEDSEGVLHEVTPFINSLYNSQDSLSFDNFFHQVGQGKTSDAENMLDNSLFGTETGSAMVKFGKDNTYMSAPTIFKELGYTTSVYHGNIETFWNRNNAYKSFGYDNFFSLKDFENQEIVGYGIKDEHFFKESVEKYNQIEGKQYSKFIPVSHHFPYEVKPLNTDFPIAKTSDETINNYFATANYMDKQIEQFYKELEKSGKLENTILVLYGDHYGISNSRNKTLNEVLKITEKEDWNSYNNAMLQRVPLIFNLPKSNVNPKNEINHEFMGQIDLLPSFLNLMGIKDSNYLMMGQNVFGNTFDNIVEFRNKDFVSKNYTFAKGKMYFTDSGYPIEYKKYVTYTKQLDELKSIVSGQLGMSDKIQNQNLLKFRYNAVDVKEDSRFNY